MISNVFLDKVLVNDYDGMSFRHFQIIDLYSNIFRVGPTFHKIIEKVSKKPATLFNDSLKKELIEIINDKVPPRLFVLNALDNYPIVEQDIEINFKDNFYKNIDSMNINQLCHLIDRIGDIASKQKISFFGSNNNRPIAYHNLNKVISKSLGYSLVFTIFEKAKKKEYQKIDINKINKNELTNCLKSQCKLYFYLLEGLSDIILNFKEVELDKKSLTYEINKKLDPYFSIIKQEHKLLNTKGKKNTDKWKYLIDRVEIDDLDNYEEEIDD